MVATLDSPKGKTHTDDDNNTASQIKDLAKELEAWRKSASFTKEDLVARYPDLGSRRNFQRALNGELDDVNDLLKFRTARNLTELDDGQSRKLEVIHDDFESFMRARSAFTQMAKENGMARFLPLLGHSGAGKTTFVNWLTTRYPGRVVIVEAIPAWKSSKGKGTDKALCEEILTKLGCRHIPVRGATLAKKTMEFLNRRRISIVIEEAHELCIDGLMMIKALINGTQGEFVITAHPRLWSDLQRSAYSACSQLTGNRLWERIDFDLNAEDVATWFEREMAPFTDSAARILAAEAVAKQAIPHGGWNFVKGVAKTLNREGKEELTTAAVVKAAEKEVRRR